MSGTVKYIKLKRSDNYGFGFSILGGAGSELPPLIYDVIEGSPAFNSNQLSPGDIILEINGQDVFSYTTKEVLNCLRLSTREVILKLKSDNTLKEKVRHLRQTPNNSEILRSAITQNDLQGVKEILVKKSEGPEDANKTSPISSPQYIKEPSNKGSISSVESSEDSIGPLLAPSHQHDATKNDSHHHEQKSKTHKKKSDESNSCSSANKCQQRPPTCATSPPLSEDESDIESLHSFHYSPKAVDIPSAVRLAKRLFALDGFKKSDVSRHLSKNNEFSKAVAEEYLRYFNFSKDTLDIALRKFLDKFCLSGETQERERVLVHFSKRYLDCNPGQFNSQDAVHTLTCALMLLNTDLHNQNIGRKMTCLEFIENLAELNDGENFQTDILKALYCAIRSEPLKWAADEEEDENKLGKGFLEEAHRVIGNNPFLSTPIGSGVVYKKGYIMRKCCIEPSGKRTAFGKRSWKMWFCVIQDLVLYLHKDEQGARRGPPPQMGQNALRLHHALAQKAHDYSKKEHVFRLQTADQAEYLLQTSDSKELQAWIDAINFVAASLSAPPMPGAVGSQRKFQRPLLPCSITKLNVVEQLEDHVARVAHIESELNDLKINPLDKNAKSATVSSFKEKEVYLTSELRRYQCYVYLLRSRLESAGGISKAGEGASSAAGGANPLPVFDGVEVKEVGPEEVGDPAVIVPPPIPERSTRHTDSNDDEDSSAGVGEGVQDIGIQTLEKKKRFAGKGKKDEFQKELDKMIKEKEKRDKKKEKQEKKEEADTLKRKAKKKNEKDEDNDNDKNENKEKDQTEKGKDKQDKQEKQDNQSPPDDPRMGTFNRVSALFKFSKLNRMSTHSHRISSSEDQMEQLKKDLTYKEKEVAKIDTDIVTFPPEENDGNENKSKSEISPSSKSEIPQPLKPEIPQPLKTEISQTLKTEVPQPLKTEVSPPAKSELPPPSDISQWVPTELPPPLPRSEVPPPLPPKPGPNSAIMRNLGTRVINA